MYERDAAKCVTQIGLTAFKGILVFRSYTIGDFDATTALTGILKQVDI